MMSMIKSRKWIVAPIALLGFAISVYIFFSVTLGADEGFTRKMGLELEGGQIAQGWLAGSDEIALYVNGYPVSLSELMEQHAIASNSISTWRSAYDRRVPSDHASIQGKNLVDGAFYDGESPVLEAEVQNIKPLLDIWERYGADTMALGAVIINYAHLTAAIDGGFSLTDEEVQAIVAQRREYHENTVDGSEQMLITDPNTGQQSVGTKITMRDYRTDGYIEAVGSDEYWNEIMPRKVFAEETAVRWRAHAGGGVTYFLDQQEINLRIHEEAETNVVVELTDNFKLDTTLEEAFAFMEENRQYDAQLHAQAKAILSAQQ